MKEIVSKDQIQTDPTLMLVKAYRIANKRAGEAKRENNEPLYREWCEKLRHLSAEAEQRNIHIWVNENGKSGHTYAKDYKPTPDADNDFEAYTGRIRAAEEAMLAVFLGNNGRASVESGPVDETQADNENPGNEEIPL